MISHGFPPLGVLASIAIAAVLAWAMRRVERAPRTPAPGHTRGPGRRLRRAGHDLGSEAARWARKKDLDVLVLQSPCRGRLVLGTLAARHLWPAGLLGRARRGRDVTTSCNRHGGHRRGDPLVAAEAGHSVLVVGPTQSGKTTGLAVPAILEWDGPVVAASVKSDIVRMSAGSRSAMGKVWLYDPVAATGLPGSEWSPLRACATWHGARRVAGGLAELTRSGSGTGLADGEFWYATAAKLIAPLLYAAALSGRTMGDVVRWVDTQEEGEPCQALQLAAGMGVPGSAEALQAAEASWGREERQRSSIYTTAETVLEPFTAATVAGPFPRTEGGLQADAEIDPEIDPEELLSGRNTLYLCAPAHDQRRVRSLFATLVAQVIEAAYDRSAAKGGPIDPPLLVVLDEAANVAPLAELDVLASTAAGHGVQLLTVWQDLSQLNARYGTRAGSVVNNHRAKLFLAGIADPSTLEHASLLVGESERSRRSTTQVARGDSSITDAPVSGRLVPADALRRMEPGNALLLYGHLPPARLALRYCHRPEDW